MTTFRVHFGGHADQSVEVEADNYDTAIDVAYDQLMTDLCWQCSTNAPSFRDHGTVTREWPDEMEPYEVTVGGESVWTEKSELEQLRAENAKLRAQVQGSDGNPAGTRSASRFTTPESAAEQARNARRVMDQFRNLAGGGDRG